jgi:hypothetical protein
MTGEQGENNQQYQRNRENVETGHKSSQSRAKSPPGRSVICLNTGRAGSAALS